MFLITVFEFKNEFGEIQEISNKITLFKVDNKMLREKRLFSLIKYEIMCRCHFI